MKHPFVNIAGVDYVTAAALAKELISSGTTEPYWTESARMMLTALVMHVGSCEDFEGRRNLLTVRDLIMRGDVDKSELLREDARPGDVVPSEQVLLWKSMGASLAFEGMVARVGNRFTEMLLHSPREFETVRHEVIRHTRLASF